MFKALLFEREFNITFALKLVKKEKKDAKSLLMLRKIPDIF